MENEIRCTEMGNLKAAKRVELSETSEAEKKAVNCRIREKKKKN